MTDDTLKEEFKLHISPLIDDPECLEDPEIIDYYFDVMVEIAKEFSKSRHSKNKGNAIHGLDKVPNNSIISSLKVELGQAKSEITHLESELKKSKPSAQIQKFNEKLQKKDIEIKILKESRNKKEEKLSKQIVTLNKKHIILEKQLFQYLKKFGPLKIDET